MKKHLALLAIFLLLGTSALPQLVQQIESFESSSIFPAPGWRQEVYETNVNTDFVLQPVATTTNPTCAAAPGGGQNVMMFNNFTGTSNDTAVMITKPFDFSNNLGSNPQLSFYMYRDNGQSAKNDLIRVYINTSPSIIGATLLSNTLGVNKISRYYNTAPVTVANTWNQYTYDLNAATYTAKRYYFIIMGVSKAGNNIYLDRFQVNTFPSAASSNDVNMDLFFQNTSAIGSGTEDQVIVGIRCIIGGTSGCGIVNGALSTAVKLDSLLLNTNGTTLLTDISNAKIYYTGGSNFFDTSYVSPFPVTLGSDDYPSNKFGQRISSPTTNMDFINSGNSCFYLEYDTTYFWLTYDLSANAKGGNFVDADFRGVAVGGSPGTCPSPGGTSVSITPRAGGFTLDGSCLIDLAYCQGTYTIGTSRSNGSYSNNDYIKHVILNGSYGSAINTTVGAKNNNAGLPSNLACLVSNGGPGCDFTTHPPDYEFWPSVSGRTVVLTQAGTYSVSVRAGNKVSNFNNIAVFIDYNRDGDFTDAGEKLGQVSLPSLGIGSIPFTTPATGYTGVTRMRVREVFNNSNIDPCSQQTYGEIEDFTVFVFPNCPSGYKLWLGNTDDWSDVSNWCGGRPTLFEDVVLDRAQVFPPIGTPTRTYFHPIIKSNVFAQANNLSISSLDTIEINAPSSTSNVLKTRRDLTNNGALIINSEQVQSTTFGKGAISNNIYTPFKAQSSDARTQIIYSFNELLNAGLNSNDVIKGLEFSLNSKGSVAAYGGFTISYALVPIVQHASNVPYAGALTPVYGPVSFSNVLGVNIINFNTPIVWNGTSSLLLQICFDNSSTIGSNDDRINLTQTTGIKSTLILSSTVNAAPGCSLIPGAGVTDNFFSGLSSNRPNISFIVDRPYNKVNLTVQEDFINNGNFVPAYSKMIMDSTAAQTISGSQSIVFNELEINKSAATQAVTMVKSITIDTSLILSQGLFVMNGFSLTMNNPALNTGNLISPLGAFKRTNGFLISESENSNVLWKNINSIFGYRVIPFGNNSAAPNYIPFSFNHKSGNMGDVTVSTYAAPGNLPFPSVVDHLNNTATPPTNNAAAVADRFWNLAKSGSNPVADIIFRFSASERPAGLSAFNAGKAQPYRTTSNTNSWLRLVVPFTNVTYTQSYGVNASPAFDSVRVTSWDWPTLPQSPSPYTDPAGPIGNSNPWVVSLNNSLCGYGVPAGLTINVVSITNATCPSTSNGSIVTSVLGGSAPFSYLWSNGSVNANISNVAAGSYTVTVTDANGLSASTSAVITTLNQLPAPLGTVAGQVSVCAGSTGITYVVPASAGATSYQWTVPANASVSSGQGTTAITVNYSAGFVSGNVCVTANNLCGSTTASCISVIGSSSSPSTPSTISGTAYGVCGLTRTYSVTNVANVTYSWSVPAGASIASGQGTKSISVVFTTSFVSGPISVIAFNACGNSNARTKTVYGKPSKPTVINGPTTFCSIDTVTFSTVAVFGNNTYVWTVPAGYTILSGQNTTSISVTGGAAVVNGSVCVKAKNTCGTSGNLCITINTTAGASAIGTISGQASGVCGSTKTYSITSQVGATYVWSVPTGATLLSGQGTSSISVSFTGSFTTGNISVTKTAACGSPATGSLAISGKPAIPSSISGPVTPCFNAQNVTYTCSVTSGASSYTWTVPAGVTIVSGQGTNAVVLNFAGTAGSVLAIKAKASNACGTSTNFTLNVTLQACPRLSSDENMEILLYPNPTNDELTVSWSSWSDEKVQLSCIDILGQTIYQKEINANEGRNEFKLNTSIFADGVYFMQISENGEIHSRKFVVKH